MSYLVGGNGGVAEAGRFRAVMAAVTLAVENPDDAAGEKRGDKVGPCICHSQFGRACIPTMSHFSPTLSCF